MQQLIKEAADAGVILFCEDGKLGFKLTVDTFPPALKQRIVAHKAELIEFFSKYQASQSSKFPPLTARDTSGMASGQIQRLPASFAQQRLWFVDEMEGGSHFYNVPVMLPIEDDFDASAAEKAINTLIERHESLRTRFDDEAGDCIQVIYPPDAYTLPIVDISHLEDEAQNAKLNAEIAKEQTYVFNLRDEHLFRAVFIKTDDDEGVLSFVMHHIVSDGWSMSVLTQEFQTLYQAYSLGLPSQLPDIELQYADYSLWQQQWMNDGAIEPQIDFWQQTLAGVPQVHNLPLDYPRPVLQTFNGAMLKMTSQSDYAPIAAWAKQLNVTPFILFYSIFSLVLSRHSNSQDIVVGTPVSGRTERELEPMIGFFVNMLVLRSDTSDNPSFTEYVTRTRDVVLNAQSHQHVPFEYLIERVNPTRSISHSPVFQIVFSVDAEGLAALETMTDETLDELKALADEQTFDAAYSTSKFDLTFDVIFDAGQLGFSIEYNTDLFNAQSAQTLLTHMDVMLAAALASPDTPINALPMLTNTEKQHLVHDLNQTNTDYQCDVLVHELFEAQVAKTPDSLAVQLGDSTLTYAQLNAQANQLARVLRENGVQPDDMVGICMDRGCELMVAIFAILKAGAGYLPIDSGYPQQRIDYIVQNSGLSVMLTTEQTRNNKREDTGSTQLTQAAVTVLSIDSNALQSSLVQQATDNLPRLDAQSVNNLVYVIYTSGSTGNPKGVMVEHRNEINLLPWYVKEYGMTANDHVLIISASGFDLTQKNFFAPLIVGGSVHFATPRDFDVAAINEVIASQDITFINCAPSVFYPLVEQQDDMAAMRSLRVVLFGGEPIAFNRLQAWLQAPTTHVDLVNMYGPTECTDIACAYTVPTSRYNQAMPIGRPNDNVELYILNESFELAPFGAAGELCIGGHGVGRGYIGREDLNQQAFIAHPFSDDPQAKLYRTGDLVRYQPDGNIEFIGRIDHQVKLRGLRIELGEIETQLTERDDVEAVLVMVREDTPDNQRLVAYVVPSDAYQHAVDNENAHADYINVLREHLLATLPDYMVPSAFVLLAEFALTPNGKIDRKTLPVPSGAVAQEDDTPPSTELEVALVAMWKDLLGLEHVGIHSNFFALGGHSLLITRMIHRVSKQLDMGLALKDVFRHPTVYELAQFLTHGGSDMLRIEAGDIHEFAPLSYAQYRLWFIEQVKGATNAHNVPSGYRINTEVDPDVLQRALNRLVARHPILRTEIQVIDGEPMQRVRESIDVTVRFEDVSGGFFNDKEGKTDALVSEHGQQAFDLAQAPFFSVLLVKVKKAIFELHINFHHILVDAWTIPVFFGELFELYSAEKFDEPAELPEVNYHYMDYARWQHAWLASEEATKHGEFWQKYLHGCNDYLAIPGQKPLDDNATNETHAAAFAIDKTLQTQLIDIAKAENGSLFNVLYSSFVVLLSRFTGETDFNIGVPVSGRNQPETELMVGFFLNNLPLRNRISLDTTFSDFLRAQVQMTESVLSHQDLPLEKILELCPLDRNNNEPPLFQIFFNMSNAPDEMEADATDAASAENAGSRDEQDSRAEDVQDQQDDDDDDDDIDIEPARSVDIASRFKLAVYIGTDEDNTYFTLLFNAEMIEESLAAMLVSQYQSLLKQIVDDPHKPCATYNLQIDEHAQLQALVTQDLLHNPENLIPETFTAIAAKNKRQIAIEEAHQQWTYHELSLAVQAVANTELDHPVAGLDDVEIVPIVAQRSASLIIAILGVLRAGKAFCLIEASHPVPRVIKQLQQLNNTRLLVCGNASDYPQEWLTAVSAERSVRYISSQKAAWDFKQIETDKAALQRLSMVRISPSQVASVAFTSGSTGEPKGVMGTHTGLSGYLSWMPKQYKLTKKQQFALVSGVTHDITQRDIFTSLCLGATLHIPTEVDRQGPKLARWLLQQQINVMHITPSLADMLCTTDVDSLPKLTHLFMSGEVLYRSTVERLRELNNKLRIFNMFGATETQRSSTYYEVPQVLLNEIVPFSAKSVDTRIMILNNAGTLCGEYELGELYVEGHHLAQGYLGDDNLSQERFIRNADGTRCYRTGDLGRYHTSSTNNAECTIVYAGRADEQLSIRGVRVEPAEITAVLQSHPQINQAAVVQREISGQSRLLAYVVANTDEQDPNGVKFSEEPTRREAQQLQFSSSWLADAARQLPAVMLPEQLIILERMPMTANQKVDTDALPVPFELSVVPAPNEMAEPKTSTEQRLLALWQTLLKHEGIHCQTEFFEVGGHSLLVTQMIFLIQQQFEVELSFSDCFAYTTVRRLATHIDSLLISASVD